MNLRKMMIEDLDRVTEIDNLCFPVAWHKNDYENELLNNEFAKLYVLERDNQIIGYIDFWITFDICQLTKIAVLSSYRGTGYSKILMNYMIQKAEQSYCENISLEVRVSNDIAQKLYESYGFIKANVRKNYYQDNGEDAFFMIKPLGGNLL